MRTIANRAEAGQQLASQLKSLVDDPTVIVLGLPRGGVPVAYEIATQLHAPLDLVLVRKLGVPGHEELAMGAIASGGIRYFNQDIIWNLQIPKALIARVVEQEEQELLRRGAAYQGNRPPLDVRDKTVILVDDGVATGSSLRAAIKALRTQNPAKIIAAVGVAPPETCSLLEDEVDELVCLLQPDPFGAVGVWYDEFGPVEDTKVCDLLALAQRQFAELLSERCKQASRSPSTTNRPDIARPTDVSN